MQLESFSIFDFGISEDHFWRLTPAKFFYLSRRAEAKVEQDDFRMAYILATICNANRSRKQRALKPADFLPKKGRTKKRVAQSPNQLHAKFKSILGHRVVSKTEEKERVFKLGD